MRIFVLSAGRSGTLAFAEACKHIENYSSAHESRSGAHPKFRLEYPDDHIEIDNRLSWFLGLVEQRYPNAVYVHLLRDREKVARSFLRRWGSDPSQQRSVRNLPRSLRGPYLGRHPRGSIIEGFAYPILAQPQRWDVEDRLAICRFYWDTVNANISTFLRGKPHMRIDVEEIDGRFPIFCDWIDAKVDCWAAIEEFRVGHHVSQ